MNHLTFSIDTGRMNFNEITIKEEPVDYSYLEPGADAVGMGFGSLMGSIKMEEPDIDIKHEPIEDVDVGESAPAPPVKVFQCPNCPKEITSLNM